MEERKSGSSKATASEVVGNPNGTYTYLIPAARRYRAESQSSNRSSEQEVQGVLLPVFGSDDEAFFIVHEDVPDFVDTILRIYLQHSKIFVFITTLNFGYELLVDYVTYQQRDEIIDHIQHYAVPMSAATASKVFWAVFVFDLVFALVLFLLGLVAVQRKSYPAINAYSRLSLIGCFQIIFLTFQRPQYSIPIGLFRVAAYLYSKFLAHLILNLLLLPH